MKIYCYIITAAVTLFISQLAGCKKDEVFPDPYEGGQSLLAISFLNKTPMPSRGIAGQDMTFYVDGLKMANAKDIKFLASDLEASIKNITDSTITITLPQNVSSGAASLRVDGQVFQGPNIYIEGKLYRDATFKSGLGTNGIVYDILRDNDQYIIAGNFSSYNLNSTLGGLAKINSSGEKVDGLTAGNALSAGSISSIIKLPNSDLMIGGLFSMFDSVSDMNNITLLTGSGSLRTRIVDLYVAPDISDPSYAKDTVPQFIGNLSGFINKLYYYNNQVTAVGSMSGYSQYFYERSTKDNKLIAYSPVISISRMFLNGTLDSNYLFNKADPTKKLTGFNGSISDSYMQGDGKLIVVGSFTSFNGTACNRIVRLNVDGSIDQTFRSGLAANESISSITYNSTTQKFIIAGSFTDYNGASINNIAILNDDGSLDAGFKTTGAFTGGIPTFASQLSNGLIIVTGGFEKYNNITRKGLMVLNANGSLAVNYNSTGAFNGIAYKMIETKSGIGGLPAAILVGYIDTFEGQKCGGIIKLVFGN
ncbi:DUF5008 domain-containing protein [Niabella ginsengisoli]|uniref:DUF5008 domain-containing protein n=1 Tax=Niabella ginsengisoli TaxID=522298 RepID=A0ABS9SIX8_9BACT|nr:DUF5008 domain-containing protein [Niabella ginsengisoli]MCH5598304.1 DUF5008 domain-containing protein [Niabella ginsengisoli]